jgi:hypothetical protein
VAAVSNGGVDVELMVVALSSAGRKTKTIVFFFFEKKRTGMLVGLAKRASLLVAGLRWMGCGPTVYSPFFRFDFFFFFSIFCYDITI